MKKINLYIKLLVVAAIAMLLIDRITNETFNNDEIIQILPPDGQVVSDKTKFSFAVLGDSAGNDEPLATFIKRIRQNHDFMIHVGDQAKAETIEHYAYLLHKLNDLLEGFPFYCVPGNHDVTKEKDDAMRLRFYSRNFGLPYYWFGYGNTLFIGLDNSNSTMSDKQLKFLEKTLEMQRKQFAHCFIYMHKPPVDPRPGQEYAMRENVDKLEAILRKFPINAIFCGHLHEYFKHSFAGIDFYVTPSSGQEPRGEIKDPGYLVVNVNDDKVDIKLLQGPEEFSRDEFDYVVASKLARIDVYIAIALLILAFILAIIYGKEVKNN
ncbi:MAG: metallophosphoesterase family protein, partial [Lentisphaeria bacterium]